MKTEIVMPRFGAKMQAGEILEWKVAVGDHVEEDDELCEVKTEKNNAVVESLYTGTILEITAQVGDSIPVGGVIGYIDDYMKVKHHQNTGLTAPQKFLLQLAAAILFTVLMRSHGYLSPVLYIPFLDVNLALPWPVYMVFAAFVMVGTVNAVNITDGIDGLAAGVTIPVMAFFTVLAWYWQHLEIGLFSGALMGGLFGFLLYNFHPAKVFMGDTGSLFLGGAVCGLAFALDVPLVLIPVGIIYIAETLSDIIQVGYFKLTHGKRIFRMAPLHHHLEMGGWSEVKLFCVFSGITLVMCVLTFLGVMNR